MQFDSVKELVSKDFQAVDALILSSLHSKASIINDLGRYLIDGGGKRLRPLLVLLIARACGYQGQHHVDLAAVIELIHTATLLHDDVVDNSELRRGHQTANRVFGNEAAILVGDFLYSKAFQIMTNVAAPSILKVVANTTSFMAEGEALQLMESRNPDTSEDNYLNIIRAKTAKLFEAASWVGALLADSDENTQKAMCLYGTHLGTAFQLIDDLLDYQSDSADTGKALGRDLSEGKVTLPLIYLLQNGTPAEVRLVREAIQNGGLNLFPEIQSLIETSGALEYTMHFAQIEVNRAHKALGVLPDSKYREGAKALAQFALERKQ
jgi:octaprenyl-diphosphate synthase